MDGMYEDYADLAALSGGTNCTICGEWHEQAEIIEINGESFCPECVALFFPNGGSNGNQEG